MKNCLRITRDVEHIAIIKYYIRDTFKLEIIGSTTNFYNELRKIII